MWMDRVKVKLGSLLQVMENDKKGQNLTICFAVLCYKNQEGERQMYSEEVIDYAVSGHPKNFPAYANADLLTLGNCSFCPSVGCSWIQCASVGVPMLIADSFCSASA